MNLTAEILQYLRGQYEKTIGKPMDADSTMHSAQAAFYVRNLDENLIEPMSAETVKAYKEGDGKELEQKMRALRSSSAMTYNLLGNGEAEIKADSEIFLPGKYHISYEKQLETIQNNPHKANLDAFLEGEHQLIFCEMKMTEWLFNKPGMLSQRYLEKEAYIHQELYDAAMECLQAITRPNPSDYQTYYCAFTQYDAFQMFKHTLAVYNYAAENRTSIPAEVRLVNCVWQLPDDAELSAAAMADYRDRERTEHREFEQFRLATAAMRKCFSDIGIDFDILFLPAKAFAEQFVKTTEQRQYLRRYFGEHGGQKQMKQDSIDELLEAQKEKHEFYRIPALNYTGMFGGKPYTEWIAAMLYEEWQKDRLQDLLLKGTNLKSEKEFPDRPIHVENGQKAIQHYNPGSNRNEENIAKRLFEQKPLEILGFPDTEVIDYQVPVNRVWHSGAGKVDLVLTNQYETIIGELKDPDSKETLLRAIVEAMTYQRKIKKEPTSFSRFVKSYGHDLLQPAVLIFAGEKSQPWKDYIAMKNGEMPELAHLARAMDILFFEVIPDEKYDDAVPYDKRFYKIARL